MYDSASSAAESSLLIWVLAAIVATLAAHVGMGWVRQAQQQEGLRQQWRGLLLAGVVLGTGLCAAMVLMLASEALPFAVGYRKLDAPVLWLIAMVGASLACLVFSRSPHWAVLLAGSLLLAATATLVQAGWLRAVGFRPGISWRPEFTALATVTMTLVFAASLWMGFSEVSRESERRTLWRAGAALAAGLGVMVGQEFMTSGIGLLGQVGSIYMRELPGTVLSLIVGVMLPLLLVLMTIDLALRRPSSRRSRDGAFDPAAPRRRRRRRRVRSL